jgi:hypothetical protein
MDAIQVGTVDRPVSNESNRSVVSWAAVIAGAVVSMAIALVVVTLGSGLGLASLSPWPNAGATATSFKIATGIGLIVVHWLASAGGGYVTGRLRVKWVGVHTHEVFFRDTAHGFLTWALASIIGAVMLTSIASSVASGGVHTAATVAGGAAQGGVQGAEQSTSGVSAYDVDSLFRSDRPDANANPQASNAEASGILASGLATGDVPAADRTYLAQMVAAHTGLSQPDAQKRVDDVIAKEQAAVVKAKQAAEAARKAASEVAIFTALAMLIGAFIASAAAAYGGSIRDEHEA